MADMDCNEASLDVMSTSAGWVIAGGGVPGKWTKGVSCLAGLQHRIVVGGVVSGLAKAVTGLQGT